MAPQFEKDAFSKESSVKIAVVGTGISGMVAAWLLNRSHEVTVFEANDYIGGHTHTVPVDLGERTYAVDTGFIVFNNRTYPNFIRLLDQLGVASQDGPMSFSVKCERTGLEYCGSTLNTLFAQRSNLFRPSFHRMVRDILRFNRESRGLLDAGHSETLSLGAYLDQRGYSTIFREKYLIPMGAAIWSTSPQQMLDFPAAYFVRFFFNHGLLAIRDRPQWKTITGGSWKYVEKLTAPYRDRIRLNAPVASVRRYESHVEVQPVCGEAESFDQVVLATHGDQSLRLLADPTPREREVLSHFRCQPNEAVLHTDVSLLPKRRLAWASWNYHVPREPLDRVAVTYQMNMLQGLDAPEQFCVTLNRTDAIQPDKVIAKMRYEHPVYTAEAVAAQRRHAEISGTNRTHFCGAYWGHGFHEDGVKSALAVGRAFGETF